MTAYTYITSIEYDDITKDFAMYLDGELTGFARTYQEAESLLNAQIARLKAQAPAPAPVIAADLPVAPEAVDGILADRELEAEREIVRAEGLEDADAARYATAQYKALKRARKLLANAARAGRNIATQLLNGDWDITGSQGDMHTIRREGMQLLCSCPHGDGVRRYVLAAARGEDVAPPRGQCWHVPFVAAIEDATEAHIDARDLAADLTPPYDAGWEEAVFDAAGCYGVAA